jgi:putative ABC transport system ATP-binding protein
MLLTPTIELDPASNADYPVALETRHLSRALAGKVLVDGITVQLRQGEVVAVVGPSGAGKSSFLRLLNRLDEPTAGTVLIKGRDYRQMRPQDLRDVNNLSGGEAQRVSVARTLANNPDALLLDEPTSALDEISARGIEDLVLSIVHERRMTCVIVTHNKLQAARMADQTMILETGKLIAVGPTKELLNAA